MAARSSTHSGSLLLLLLVAVGGYRIRDDQLLKFYVFSVKFWSPAAVANLLFLESPVGVGFSCTNRSPDLQEPGDRVTANDSHDFLLSWFKRFPRFNSHDLTYIAGKSYAGHYVPQLAELIYERNKVAIKDYSYIMLRGFMETLAVLINETDLMGMVEHAWSHAILSDELYAAVTKDCNSFKEDGSSENSSGACSYIDICSIYTTSASRLSTEEDATDMI